MHRVLESATAKDYLEAFHELVDTGARRFLLHGFQPAAVAVLSAAKRHPRAAQLKLAFCTVDGDAPTAAAPIVSPDQAREQVWDAALVFSSPSSAGVPELVAEAGGELHVVYAGKRARGVLVVSIPKSGTHLVSRVMEKLGYDVQGQGGRAWTAEEITGGGTSIWAMKLGQLAELCSADGYHWLHRYVRHVATADELDPAWPTNGCIVVHELTLNRIDGEFYRNWESTNEPRIVFNYRDPRAVICSYVRFLERGGFAPSPDQLAHAAILRELPNWNERVEHALRDRTFPRADAYRNSSWLKLHPRVCDVSYEQLVGPSGGGTAEEQTNAVARIMLHLNASGDPRTVASEIFDSGSRTFSRGSVDSWKEELTASHLRAFDQLYGEVFALYGYES